MMEDNQRSYGDDESILVCEAGTNHYLTEIFDSLNVHYERTITDKNTDLYGTISRTRAFRNRRIQESFCSLQSALTDGCDYVHLGDVINFSGNSNDQKSDRVFVLPLVNYTLDHNIIPETIYFHCISGVKNATIGILSPLDKKKSSLYVADPMCSFSIPQRNMFD